MPRNCSNRHRARALWGTARQLTTQSPPAHKELRASGTERDPAFAFKRESRSDRSRCHEDRRQGDLVVIGEFLGAVARVAGRPGREQAMSEENVEIVRRLFAAFQSVDVGNFERRFDEVREILDPEVEWVAAPHPLLASEEYRGSDGVRRFWTQFLSAWDEYGVEVEELIDADDQVVAVIRLSGC